MRAVFEFFDAVNAVMLSVPMLLGVLGVGLFFTLWSGFGQYRALTHGVALVSGRGIATREGAGVLSHFEALSAALSATVGLGNIGGVAIAVSLGGPGAVFWMWMVGLAGMAVKSAEVGMSMLYRNTDDPDNPHGGTMWACKNGFAELGPGFAKVGAAAGALFTLPLILFAWTGGNMFQAWNAAEIARSYFGIETWITGLVLAVLVGLVIIGGIRRIGHVAGALVPVMCGLYLVAGVLVLVGNAEQLPGIVRGIFVSAFAPTEAAGAFTGAAMGSAFLLGMRRALFSSEAGMGSAPIAHSAVKTPEPMTESVVAGLEPFVDTLVVCTITALVILSSGIWSRDAAAPFGGAFVEHSPGLWRPAQDALPSRSDGGAWLLKDPVFLVAETSGGRVRVHGSVEGDATAPRIVWRSVESDQAPTLAEPGLFENLPGATLTAHAFDSAWDGLGRWMVSVTVFLFAFSTMITWSYYGEQGAIYLGGERWVLPYRVVWCIVIAVSCLGFIRTDAEIDTISTVALGFMLAINLPVMVVLSPRIMAAWHDYFGRLAEGRIARR